MLRLIDHLPFIRRRREEEAIAIPDISRVVPEWAASGQDGPQTDRPYRAEPAANSQPSDLTEDASVPLFADTDADLTAHDGDQDAAPEAGCEPSASAGEMPASGGGAEALLDEDIDMLMEAHEGFIETEGAREARDGMEFAAETLRATASRCDYPALSRVCRSLCRLLHEGDDTALVNLHVQAIRALRAATSGSASEDLAGAICIALETKVDAVVSN